MECVQLITSWIYDLLNPRSCVGSFSQPALGLDRAESHSKADCWGGRDLVKQQWLQNSLAELFHCLLCQAAAAREFQFLPEAAVAAPA